MAQLAGDRFQLVGNHGLARLGWAELPHLVHVVPEDLAESIQGPSVLGIGEPPQESLAKRRGEGR